MKSIHFLFCSVILFYFSEGKPCPEDSRPHKTRCDSYFKCVNLPSRKRHVWVPVKCDIGLIYERNLKTCVLPEDDWECYNNEEIENHNEDNKFEIYPAPKRKPSNKKLTKIQKEFFKINPLQINQNHFGTSNSIDNNRSDFLNELKISSNKNVYYNGSEIEFENFMKSENDINELNENNYESSGDGSIGTKDEYEIEMKESESSSIDIPDSSSSLTSTNNIDTNLVMHLQRLSQLIDGLKQKYQTSDNNNNNTIGSGDLRPDQLNAFLAHYNIKSEFDAVQPNTEKIQVPENGKIQPEILRHVLKQQHKLSMDTMMPIDENSPSIFEKPIKGNSNINYVSKVGYSKNKSIYNPTLKVLRAPSFNNYDDESKSILINLVENQINEPELPEDTLKTVIKLSKDMASNENTRQVIKVNGIFQPLLQQSYYGSPTSELYHQNPFRRHDTEHFYEIITDDNYNNLCNDNVQMANKVNQHSNGDHNNGSKELWLSQTTENPQFIHIKKQNTIDSYGNEVPDYIEYPPYKDNQKFISTTTDPFSTTSPIADQNQREVTIPNIFTPSPHLDNTNINKIIEIDNFPTIPYIYPANRIKSPMEYKSNHQNQFNLIPSSHSYAKIFNKNQFSPYHHQLPYPNLFQVNPDTVTIEPNSYKKPNVEEENEFIYDDHVKQIKNTNKNSVLMNKQQIVNELLATATSPLTSSSLSLPSSSSNSDQIIPHVQNSFSTLNKINKNNNANNNDQQLINLAGNFINYDLFKNNILPLIVQNENNEFSTLNNFAYNFEIVSCNSGSRQPNSTDCTKYYVCSKKDGRILSYSCPPYTAFNSQTRICDAQTFKMCNPSLTLSDANNYHSTLLENHKIQLEAIKSLQEAKRIREEAIKAQNLANLIRLEAQKINEENHKNQLLLKHSLDNKFDDTKEDQLNENSESTLKPMVDLIDQQQNEKQHNQQVQKQQNQQKQQNKQQQKRRYYCREGAKIPDQLSVFNYYVCYKTKDGVMHGHKMKCTSGLIFCAKSSMCTLPKRCSTR